MSNWTHVAAIFRIDCWRTNDGEMNFEKIFGRELNDFAPRDVWLEADEHPERFLPCGSEGSLEMSVWTNPNPCDMAAYTVSIFGDLRDHDSAKEIIKWFEKKCKELSGSIRQAVITVDNERNGSQTKTYEGWFDVEEE